MVTGHSCLFDAIHEQTGARPEDADCSLILAYGGKRAYTRIVRREGTPAPRESAMQRSHRLEREGWTCRTIAPGRSKGGDGTGPRTEAEMRASLGSSPFTAPAGQPNAEEADEEADSDTDESDTSGGD